MQIAEEFSYRNGKEILQSKKPMFVKEILDILQKPNNKLDLTSQGGQRTLSSQIQKWFVDKAWEKEKSSFSIPSLHYDLVKEEIPIEIEIGHERLVYADFFEFMADYSKGFIPLGVMIVTENPNKFGHNWHNSLKSTVRKIDAIKETFLVPLWIIGINP